MQQLRQGRAIFAKRSIHWSYPFAAHRLSSGAASTHVTTFRVASRKNLIETVLVASSKNLIEVGVVASFKNLIEMSWTLQPENDSV